MISNFSELFTELKEKGICRKLVVAWGVDEHSIEASYRAVEMGFVQAILVGDRARIEKVCAEKGFEIGKFTIVDEPVELKAVSTAVAMVHDKAGDVLMKGLCSTDKLDRKSVV